MNLPEKIKVEIKQQDRENCEDYHSNTNCLVATSLKRQLRLTNKVSVAGDLFNVWSGQAYNSEILAEYRFTQRTADKICDAYQEFKPFSFTAKRVI